MLAAQPATAVQLAHACLQMGFEAAIPASWGDEMVAAESVQQLASRTDGSAIFCACPYVESALLAQGPDLAPLLLPVAAPPVATARYLRHLYGDLPLRITYVGRCPSAFADAAIDVQLAPDVFLHEMEERGVVLAEQPTVFDSVLPPDRRRYCSLPGGAPAPSCLWDGERSRTLIEIESEDYKAELAQQLIAHRRCLIDLAPRLGCACSGAATPASHASARASVLATEPPRATGPVIEAPVELDLSRRIVRPPAPIAAASPPRPATPRSSAAPAAPTKSTAETRHGARGEPAGEVARAAARETPRESPRQSPPIRSAEPQPTQTSLPHRAPTEPPPPPSGRTRKTTPSGIFRVYTGHVPRTRGAEGQLLPRAYAAFRKPPVGSRPGVAFAPTSSDVPVAIEPHREPLAAEPAVAEPTDSVTSIDLEVDEIDVPDTAAPYVGAADVAAADVAAADIAARDVLMADIADGMTAKDATAEAAASDIEAADVEAADVEAADLEAADVAAHEGAALPTAESGVERARDDDETDLEHAAPGAPGASERATDAASDRAGSRQAPHAPDLHSAIAMARSNAIGVRDVPPAAVTRPSALPLVAIALLALLTAAAVAIAVFLLRSNPAPERRAVATTPLLAPSAVARPDSALAPAFPPPATDSVAVGPDSTTPSATDSAANPAADSAVESPAVEERGSGAAAVAHSAARTPLVPRQRTPRASALRPTPPTRAAPVPAIVPSESTPTAAASSLGPSVFRVVPRPYGLPARPAGGSRLSVEERDSIQREILRRRAGVDSAQGTGDALAPRR